MTNGSSRGRGLNLCLRSDLSCCRDNARSLGCFQCNLLMSSVGVSVYRTPISLWLFLDYLLNSAELCVSLTCRWGHIILSYPPSQFGEFLRVITYPWNTCIMNLEIAFRFALRTVSRRISFFFFFYHLSVTIWIKYLPGKIWALFDKYFTWAAVFII